jgi:hypothetical protein
MADQPPNETAPKSGGETQPGDIAAELRALGDNLKDLLRSIWESEERRRMQQEVETGLKDLGTKLDQAVTEFRESPSGKQFQADVEELRTRVNSGEVAAEIRTGVLEALRSVNAELAKAAPKKGAPPPPPTAPPGGDNPAVGG